MTGLAAQQTPDASTPDKPACDGRHLGMFWPLEANRDRRAFDGYTHNGSLQVCSHGSHRGFYRYYWQDFTVSYGDLLKAAREKQSRGAHSGM